MIKKGIKMTELKTFKIEQNFNSIEDLYGYLSKNVDFISESTGLRIQKPLKKTPYSLVGKEKITERKILFFASKNELVESLGELIVLAGATDADVVVFFLPKITPASLEPLNWLQKICNADTQFFAGEAGL